jgi:hypothetical protein
VKRIANADEFRVAYDRIRGTYRVTFQRQLDALRAWYDGLPREQRPPDFDEALEYHARCYLINGLLAGLNWRLDLSLEDGLPNLFPEIGVLSEASGTRRFLDYLGIERSTNNPLLIVEAKRPNSHLPDLATLPDIPIKRTRQATAQSAISITDTGSVVISRGLAGKPLSGDWSQWLEDLRDYVRSVNASTGKVPKRVVITNGDWLILFLQPAEAFVLEDECDPRSILVFRTSDEILEGSAVLYSKLEHQAVLAGAPVLRPVEIPFHIEPSHIQNAMHGLRLRYEQAKAIYQREPMIYVAPVLFLRTILGAWLRVESSAKQYSIPHDPDKLPTHLEDVRAGAYSLLTETCQILHTKLTATSLEQHFADSDSFDTQHAIVKLPDDQYWIVTGSQTHFLIREPTVPNCPYHSYGHAHNEGVAAQPGPVLQRSVDPRSFFFSPETHHCAHQNVALAKSQSVTTKNRERCGPRSSRDGEAFCEIWGFESRLCCRTCVFEPVCTKAQVFHLLCHRPVQIETAIITAASKARSEQPRVE